jgi:sulfur-oxidizing protein SoxY
MVQFRSAMSIVAALLGAGLATAPAKAIAQSEADAQRWKELSAAIFHDQTLQDGGHLIAIDAPYRADDAAVVPLAIRFTLPADDARQVRKVTLVIDANPSPVAATFTLGDNTGTDSISTRVRVDDYTYVHAIAELSDGRLYVAQRYVKAAGGCSAPATRQVADSIPTGAIRVRLLGAEGGENPSLREAQVMVHHPNYSGMQMDQVTRLYVPAFFVHHVSVTQDGRPILDIDSNISISENPEYRFDFRPHGNAKLHF